MSAEKKAQALARSNAERVLPTHDDESVTQRTIRAVIVDATLPLASALVQAKEALERADQFICQRSIAGCAHEDLQQRCWPCHVHVGLTRLRSALHEYEKLGSATKGD